MNKIIYILVCVFSLNVLNTMAQHTIQGQLKPLKDQKSILLYKTEGAFQYYRANTTIDEDGFFGFSLPVDFKKGTYKLVYDAQNDLYVNIIFNDADITFVFNPNDLINSISFLESKENILYYDYIKQINIQNSELKAIQKLCYTDYQNKELVNSYIAKNAEIDAFQTYFENESKGLIVNSFIKAFKKTNSSLPLGNKDEYFRHLKTTYLNTVDFQDTILRNSAFLIDRLNEYVFDLNAAISNRAKTNLDTLMLNNALAKIEESKFKNEVIYSLTNTAFDPYSSKYDYILNYIYNHNYINLPVDQQNKEFATMVKAKLGAIVGKKASNIAIGDSSLHDIKSKKTLIIFWSTTCSHCLKEIPEIYELLKDSKEVEVVLIGLEEVYSDWEFVILNFPNFTHIRANGKWDNKYAKAYNIKSTPAYFLLDENKIITNKPDKLKDVNALFESK